MGRNHDEGHILEGFPIGNLRNDLLQWWSLASRHFPWRETRDPYRVLIAEILLHRTRADQVVLIYELFLKRFPNIQTLAKSTPDELAELYHSAGLYWRWKLLHSMAVEIKARFQGKIPDAFEDLTSLPGVSQYTASSLRCFAFGYPEAILDTNTVRVAGRLLGLPITDSSRRSVLFRTVLQFLIDLEYPRDFNFALIDFAAIVCRAKSPCQGECPLQSFCHFYRELFSMGGSNKRSRESGSY